MHWRGWLQSLSISYHTFPPLQLLRLLHLVDCQHASAGLAAELIPQLPHLPPSAAAATTTSRRLLACIGGAGCRACFLSYHTSSPPSAPFLFKLQSLRYIHLRCNDSLKGVRSGLLLGRRIPLSGRSSRAPQLHSSPATRPSKTWCKICIYTCIFTCIYKT